MIALPSPSPPLFPNLGWSFESPDDHQQNNNYFCTSIPPYNYHHETTQTFVLADSNDLVSTSYDLQLLPQQIFHPLPADSVTPDVSSNGDTKKLHHNASERDRRKKMNTLYSSLRSLLPAADDMKKWSIPSTVARVVKYIPELQQEVQKLIVEKEKLLSKTIAKRQVHDHNQSIQQQNETKETNKVSLSGISVNRLENGDVVIQIPAQKSQDCPSMSELLLNLEEQGLLPLNASSFESFSGTLLFYNLHLQVKENYEVDYGDLKERLVSLLEKKKKN